MKPETLPPAQQRALEMLARKPDDDFDGELVVSHGEAWIGQKQVSMRTVYGLLGLMLVRDESVGDDMQRYVLSGTGRDLLLTDPVRKDLVAAREEIAAQRLRTEIVESERDKSRKYARNSAALLERAKALYIRVEYQGLNGRPSLFGHDWTEEQGQFMDDCEDLARDIHAALAKNPTKES